MTTPRSALAISPAPVAGWRGNLPLVGGQKLTRYLTDVDRLMVEIRRPGNPSDGELGRLREVLSRNNFVFYQYGDAAAVDGTGYQTLCKRLGLSRRIGNPASDNNGVSRIAASGSASERYIPYTRRALRWHTDGYYNPTPDQVGAFVLHCEAAAESGGANQFLDHEVLFALLMEQDPGLVETLFEDDLFTVPANVVDGETVRPAFTGPVFQLDPTGRLVMRYSERTRNLHWRDDSSTALAVGAIRSILESDCEWVINHTLAPGQGVICNNTLHRRDAFSDGPDPRSARSLRRIRFADRVDPGGFAEDVD